MRPRRPGNEVGSTYGNLYSFMDNASSTRPTDENVITADDETTPPALGDALRLLRRGRGLTLAQVAEATDISKSFLSLVEGGKSDITIGRLMRLVSFYGVSVTDLIPGARNHQPVSVIRAGEGRSVASPSEGIRDILLAPDTKRSMLPLLAVFEAGGKNVEAAQHDGEEFLYVIDGSVKVEIEGHEPVILEPGDSMFFEATLPHWYENVADCTARIVFVVSPPHI
jgi:quercetin dioxygenase-like cupin family protein